MTTMTSHSDRILRALRLPLLCALLWLLSAGSAHASINCTASMTAVAFGTVDLVAGTATPANATLTYTCTKSGNNNTTEYARVCFNIGDGNEGLTNFNPRVMKNGAGDSLKFQLYQGTSNTIWGSNGNAAVPNPYTINISIPARSTSVSGSATMRGELLAGQSTAPPGSYQDNFSGIHTSITLTSSTNAPPTNCGGSTLSDQFAFIVSATISKSCIVTADPLNFGTVSGLPGGGNVDQVGTIYVTCTTPTGYTVALTPSNNVSNGAGAMTPTGGVPGNTDTVPYQLYRNSNRTLVWGSVTGTNTFAGTGSGLVQALPLYGRVLGASTNVRPDSYMDVVTVAVTY